MSKLKWYCVSCLAVGLLGGSVIGYGVSKKLESETIRTQAGILDAQHELQNIKQSIDYFQRIGLPIEDAKDKIESGFRDTEWHSSGDFRLQDFDYKEDGFSFRGKVIVRGNAKAEHPTVVYNINTDTIYYSREK